jgi:hypothetical protein
MVLSAACFSLSSAAAARACSSYSLMEDTPRRADRARNSRSLMSLMRSDSAAILAAAAAGAEVIESVACRVRAR